MKKVLKSAFDQMKSIFCFKNAHLLISLVIVVHTAIIYGVFTHSVLSESLDIQVETIDLSNLFRALMCLYLAISAVWFLGMVKVDYWKIATQLNILFMTSLGIGRSISILVDGLPSSDYIFGVIAELLLAVFATVQLRKYSAGNTPG